MDYWTGGETITIRGSRRLFPSNRNKGVENPAYQDDDSSDDDQAHMTQKGNHNYDAVRVKQSGNHEFEIEQVTQIGNHEGNAVHVTQIGNHEGNAVHIKQSGNHRFEKDHVTQFENHDCDIHVNQNGPNDDDGLHVKSSRTAEEDRSNPIDDSQCVIDVGNVFDGTEHGAYPISDTVLDMDNKTVPNNTHTTRNGTNVADKKWMKHIERKFRKTVDSGGQITIETFTQTLGLKRDVYCERVFELFDDDGRGIITVTQLMGHLKHLANGTPDQTLEFLFKVFDSDGDGKITREGLQHVLEACIEDSALSLAGEQLDDLTDVLFDSNDEIQSDTITFEQFSEHLKQYPQVKENLSISVSHWFSHNEARPRKLLKCPRYCSFRYIRNHYKKIVYLVLYCIVNIALFTTSFYQYHKANTWIQIARGCGQCLNLNCMWILVLMLRKSMTYLRSSKIRHFLPMDQYIVFHKITGYAIVMFSIGHIAAHIANAAVVASNEIAMWEVLFTPKAQMGHGIFTGSAYYTGWLLVILLIPMVLCSLSCIRRSGYFQIFYAVHLLYIPYWVLLMMHGSNFWMWFAVPGVIFVIEKVSGSKALKTAQYGDTWIEEVNLLPSKVTHLVINRPERFNFKSGDYINIQIPAIAKYEWHPFTISSAPEMEGKIWLHVRSAGNWTNKLYEYFENLEAAPYGANVYYVDGTESERSSFAKTFSKRTARAILRSTKFGTKLKRKHKAVNVKCYIDGPYGTGGRELLKSEHAVLIGAGIGVTPMASILQSVWYKLNESKIQCPSCRKVWFNEQASSEMKLKKVDFIWVNRDQKNFEWFLTLLSELEIQASHLGTSRHALQTHLYMTSAKKATDLKGIGLQMALDLVHEKNNKDLITGLRAKTKPGRPDWDEIFRGIKAERAGRVRVYFCGPPALGRTLKETAMRYNFDFSKESF